MATMMTPSEAQYWHVFCNAIQTDAALAARALDSWNNVAGPFLVGLCMAGLIGLAIAAMLAASYRPRIPRGGLWMPAYGLLGGTPKLYTHSKPSNLFGMLPSWHRGRKSNHH
jgi:hypothetical protein